MRSESKAQRHTSLCVLRWYRVFHANHKNAQHTKLNQFVTHPFLFLSFSHLTHTHTSRSRTWYAHTQSTNSNTERDRDPNTQIHVYTNSVPHCSVKWCPFCPRKWQTQSHVSRSYGQIHNDWIFYTNIGLINSFGIRSKRTPMINCWQRFSPIFFCSCWFLLSQYALHFKRFSVEKIAINFLCNSIESPSTEIFLVFFTATKKSKRVKRVWNSTHFNQHTKQNPKRFACINSQLIRQQTKL